MASLLQRPHVPTLLCTLGAVVLLLFLYHVFTHRSVGGRPRPDAPQGRFYG